MQDSRKPLLVAVSIVVGLTLWRVGFLALNGTDLFVDESQYWFWGQNLDFGYYSKPPMIGWLIRMVTGLAGSDASFWVRLPAPVLHMVTAFLLMGLARQLYGTAVSFWVGPVYIALPMVTVGSALMSTDTVMLPFLALALWMYFRLLQNPSRRYAVIMGVAIGLGLMSKYAAIYFVLGASLAAMIQPSARLRLQDIMLASLAALAAVSPNIWWNITNDATTVRHTMANANWGAGNGLNFAGAIEFFASQFAVFGPLLFAGLLWLAWRGLRGRLQNNELTLLLFSVPVVVLVSGQALMSKAYANWAVVAYIAGTILVVQAFGKMPKLLIATQGIHLALALVLPVLMVNPNTPRLPEGASVFQRYIGISDVSLQARSAAEALGLTVIVARNRAFLAHLNYTLRDSNMDIYALPRAGFAGSYYEQAFPVP
ncbi:MAG: ArnT family glycosyltransferase, partial [Halocynthiibacter sp.]